MVCLNAVFTLHLQHLRLVLFLQYTLIKILQKRFKLQKKHLLK